MMEPTSSSAPGSDLTGLVEEKTNGKPSAWFFQCLPANMKPYQTQVFARAWVNSDLTQCWVHRQQCSTKHNTYVIEKSGPQFKLLKYPVSFLENCKSNDVSCLICLYILIIMERERESYIYIYVGGGMTTLATVDVTLPLQWYCFHDASNAHHAGSPRWSLQRTAEQKCATWVSPSFQGHLNAYNVMSSPWT